ncbi:MAG: alpha/beta hydrolase family protein [Bacteroidota bacterium]
MKNYLFVIAVLIGNVLFAQPVDELTDKFLMYVIKHEYQNAVTLFDDDCRNDGKDAAWLKNKHEHLMKVYGKAVMREKVLKSFYGSKHIVIRFLWYGEQSCKIRFEIKKNKIHDIVFQPEAVTNTYSHLEYVKKHEYISRPVLIRSAKYALPGEIVQPAGMEPLAWLVFVHGSGPSDRDESFLGNRTFRDIAVGLAKKGIASIRYEKNTYLFAPELAAEKGMTMWDETGRDALAAFDYLTEHEAADSSVVALLGHSQGAMMIPRICDSINPDAAIMIAGNARPLQDVMYEQFKFLYSEDGFSDSEKRRLSIQKEQIKNLEKLKHTHPDSVDFALPYGLPAAYWKYLLEYDQKESLKNIDVPVLLIQGKGDYQVKMKDFRKFRRALRRSGVHWKAIAYEKVNHLLFENEKEPSKFEYERSENVEKYIIDDMADWLKGL